MSPNYLEGRAGLEHFALFVIFTVEFFITIFRIFFGLIFRAAAAALLLMKPDFVRSFGTDVSIGGGTLKGIVTASLVFLKRIVGHFIKTARRMLVLIQPFSASSESPFRRALSIVFGAEYKRLLLTHKSYALRPVVVVVGALGGGAKRRGSLGAPSPPARPAASAFKTDLSSRQ